MRFVKCGRVCTYLITYNRPVYHSEHFYLSSYGEDFCFKKSVNELNQFAISWIPQTLIMPDVVLFFTFENRPPATSVVVLLLRLQEHFVDYDNYNRLSNE